jgi:hypothetical protein
LNIDREHNPLVPVKEIKMNANRISKIFTGLLVLAVALVSVSFVVRPTIGIATGDQANAAPSKSNTYLPLPPGKQTQLFNAARDARNSYHRPSGRNVSSSAAAAVYPDYFERHPELVAASVSGAGASDYFERHPELVTPVILERDDYFLRHPELIVKAGAAVDLSDYYFRHIND